MATQQQSVIVTAIVLAIILGGALVWLLNRTPASQLATQVPEAQFSAEPTGASEAGSDLVSAEEANRLAQDTQQTQTPAGAISPTDPTQQGVQPSPGAVQGVAATAPTGPAENMIAIAVATLALGSGSGLALLFSRLKRVGR